MRPEAFKNLAGSHTPAVLIRPLIDEGNPMTCHLQGSETQQNLTDYQKLNSKKCIRKMSLAWTETKLTFSIDFLLFTEYMMHITLACAKRENAREVNKSNQTKLCYQRDQNKPHLCYFLVKLLIWLFCFCGTKKIKHESTQNTRGLTLSVEVCIFIFT